VRWTEGNHKGRGNKKNKDPEALKPDEIEQKILANTRKRQKQIKSRD